MALVKLSVFNISSRGIDSGTGKIVSLLIIQTATALQMSGLVIDD